MTTVEVLQNTSTIEIESSAGTIEIVDNSTSLEVSGTGSVSLATQTSIETLTIPETNTVTLVEESVSVVSIGTQGPQGPQGEAGEQGSAGADGLAPAHEVDGARIRFRNPDGTWGSWVVAPAGADGAAGTAGADGAPGIGIDFISYSYFGGI